jgi:hypothetical protein
MGFRGSRVQIPASRPILRLRRWARFFAEAEVLHVLGTYSRGLRDESGWRQAFPAGAFREKSSRLLKAKLDLGFLTLARWHGRAPVPAALDVLLLRLGQMPGERRVTDQREEHRLYFEAPVLGYLLQ